MDGDEEAAPRGEANPAHHRHLELGLHGWAAREHPLGGHVDQRCAVTLLPVELGFRLVYLVEFRTTTVVRWPKSWVHFRRKCTHVLL